MSDDTIQRYEQMLAEDPQSRAFAPLAEAHRKAGRLDEAIKVARAGLEVHPGYSGGLVVLGRALYEKGELDNAAEVLHRAVTDTPESYLGQKFLGKVLIDKGENTDALKALEAANLLSPEDEEVVRLLEETKSKATPPQTMVYSEGESGDTQNAQIVTYEQKPTTVDGVELPPLPTVGPDETFTFSGEGTQEPREGAPAPPQEVEISPAALEGDPVADALAEEEMTATVIEEEEVEQTMEIDSIEELGPEVAEFIMEGEAVSEEPAQTMPEDPFETMEASVGGDTAEPVFEPVSPQPPSPVPDPPASQGSEAVSFGETAENTIVNGMGEWVARAPAHPPTGPTGPDPVFDPAGEAAPGAPVEHVFQQVPPPGEQRDLESRPVPAPQQAIRPEPEPVSAPSPVEEKPRETLPHPAPAAAEPVPDPVPQPPAPEPDELLTENAPAKAAAAPFAGSEPPRGGPEADPGQDEGFSTETMADLYAQQGLVDKAVKIYRQILEQEPGNEVVKLKLAALSDQRPGDAPAAPAHQPPVAADPGAAPAKTAGEISEDKLDILERMLENAERMKRT